jgi:hypothetical protein
MSHPSFGCRSQRAESALESERKEQHAVERKEQGARGARDAVAASWLEHHTPQHLYDVDGP